MHYSRESSIYSQKKLFVKVNNKKRSSDKGKMFIPTSQNKNNNSKEVDSYQALFRTLSYLGIYVLDFKPPSLVGRLCRYIYPVLAHIVIADITIAISFRLAISSLGWQLNLAYGIVCLLTLLLWHILHRRKKLLVHIFISLKNISKEFSISDVPRQEFVKCLMVFNFMLSLIFSCLVLFMLHTSEQAHLYCLLLTYNIWKKCERTFLCSINVFLKVTEATFVTPIFSNLVSLLYCCLCYRCSVLLIRYRKKIQDIISSKKYYKLDIKLGSKYQELIAIIDKIQTAFSLPSMIIFSVSFMQAFVLFARFLLHTKRELQFMLMIEHICIHFPPGILAFVIPACASQVSTQMKRNQVAFQRIYENETFRRDLCISSDHISVVKILRDALPTTLLAGNIIKFSSSIVPSVLGSLLTYGLLVLNVNT